MGTEPHVPRARGRPCPLAGRSPRASSPRLAACPRRFAGPESSAGFQPAAHLRRPRIGSPNRVSDGEWATRGAGTGLRPSGGRMPVFRVSQASPRLAACPRRFAGPESSAGFQPAAHLRRPRIGSPNRVSDGDWATRGAGTGPPVGRQDARVSLVSSQPVFRVWPPGRRPGRRGEPWLRPACLKRKRAGCPCFACLKPARVSRVSSQPVFRVRPPGRRLGRRGEPWLRPACLKRQVQDGPAPVGRQDARVSRVSSQPVFRVRPPGRRPGRRGEPWLRPACLKRLVQDGPAPVGRQDARVSRVSSQPVFRVWPPGRRPGRRGEPWLRPACLKRKRAGCPCFA